MTTQQVYFSDLGTTGPWHGYLTDEGDTLAWGYPVFPESGLPDAADPEGGASEVAEPEVIQDKPTRRKRTVHPVDRSLAYPVSPALHPHLHTVLDDGQTVPALLYAAVAVGFSITYHRYGRDPAEVFSL